MEANYIWLFICIITISTEIYFPYLLNRLDFNLGFSIYKQILIILKDLSSDSNMYVTYDLIADFSLYYVHISIALWMCIDLLWMPEIINFILFGA